MRTMNTISNKELSELMDRESEFVCKRLNGLFTEYNIKQAEAEGVDEEKYIKYGVRMRLIDICMNAITKTPDEFFEMLNHKS